MEWKILIVDDEAEICRTLKNYLTISGYDVVTANNAEEAIEIARSEKIHIALLDIMMPGINGIELIEHLKKVDFSIQAIIMTGFSTFDLTLKALEKGANDYILKPFEDLDDIVRLIEIAIEKLERWKKSLAGTVIQEKNKKKSSSEGLD